MADRLDDDFLEGRQVTLRELEELAKRAAKIAHPAYLAANWTWRGGVPDKAAIEMTALRLLLECHPNNVRATGGVRVTRAISDGHETYAVTLELDELIADDPFPFEGE